MGREGGGGGGVIGMELTWFWLRKRDVDVARKVWENGRVSVMQENCSRGGMGERGVGERRSLGAKKINTQEVTVTTQWDSDWSSLPSSTSNVSARRVGHKAFVASHTCPRLKCDYFIEKKQNFCCGSFHSRRQ